MTDFTIDIQGQGALMSYEKSDSLKNNIFLSIRIARGTFFVKPDFGSRLHQIKKITPQNIELAAAYCKEALKWLITAGRLASVDVQAWRDEEIPTRIKFYIAAKRPDGSTLEYELFHSVV
jgi:phage gp46-like protein